MGGVLRVAFGEVWVGGYRFDGFALLVDLGVSCGGGVAIAHRGVDLNRELSCPKDESKE